MLSTFVRDLMDRGEVVGDLLAFRPIRVRNRYTARLFYDAIIQDMGKEARGRYERVLQGIYATRAVGILADGVQGDEMVFTRENGCFVRSCAMRSFMVRADPKKLAQAHREVILMGGEKTGATSASRQGLANNLVNIGEEYVYYTLLALADMVMYRRNREVVVLPKVTTVCIKPPSDRLACGGEGPVRKLPDSVRIRLREQEAIRELVGTVPRPRMVKRAPAMSEVMCRDPESANNLTNGLYRTVAKSEAPRYADVLAVRRWYERVTDAVLDEMSADVTQHAPRKYSVAQVDGANARGVYDECLRFYHIKPNEPMPAEKDSRCILSFALETTLGMSDIFHGFERAVFQKYSLLSKKFKPMFGPESWTALLAQKMAGFDKVSATDYSQFDASVRAWVQSLEAKLLAQIAVRLGMNVEDPRVRNLVNLKLQEEFRAIIKKRGSVVVQPMRASGEYITSLGNFLLNLAMTCAYLEDVGFTDGEVADFLTGTSDRVWAMLEGDDRTLHWSGGETRITWETIEKFAVRCGFIIEDATPRAPIGYLATEFCSMVVLVPRAGGDAVAFSHPRKALNKLAFVSGLPDGCCHEDQVDELKLDAHVRGATCASILSGVGNTPGVRACYRGVLLGLGNGPCTHREKFWADRFPLSDAYEEAVAMTQTTLPEAAFVVAGWYLGRDVAAVKQHDSLSIVLGAEWWTDDADRNLDFYGALIDRQVVRAPGATPVGQPASASEAGNSVEAAAPVIPSDEPTRGTKGGERQTPEGDRPGPSAPGGPVVQEPLIGLGTGTFRSRDDEKHVVMPFLARKEFASVCDKILFYRRALDEKCGKLAVGDRCGRDLSHALFKQRRAALGDGKFSDPKVERGYHISVWKGEHETKYRSKIQDVLNGDNWELGTAGRAVTLNFNGDDHTHITLAFVGCGKIAERIVAEFNK